MNIITPLLAIIVLVFLNIVLSYKGKKLYWLYEISHFVGGILLAALFINFLDGKLVLLAVLTISVLWEMHELFINRSKKIKKFLENKFRYYITPPTFLILPLIFCLVFWAPRFICTYFKK